MKILLVDDEKLQLTRLEESVKHVLPTAEIVSYTNPVLALKENKNSKIDIAFLDIEMPELNGIQLAKSLKSINPTINIVFVTAYDRFALDAMRMRASGFVRSQLMKKKYLKKLMD